MHARGMHAWKTPSKSLTNLWTENAVGTENPGQRIVHKPQEVTGIKQVMVVEKERIQGGAEQFRLLGDACERAACVDQPPASR